MHWQCYGCPMTHIACCQTNHCHSCCYQKSTMYKHKQEKLKWHGCFYIEMVLLMDCIVRALYKDYFIKYEVTSDKEHANCTKNLHNCTVAISIPLFIKWHDQNFSFQCDSSIDNEWNELRSKTASGVTVAEGKLTLAVLKNFVNFGTPHEEESKTLAHKKLLLHWLWWQLFSWKEIIE